MLIRVNGAQEGIAEYLEKGQKEGRHFTRDELDERVILEGDLTFTDQLIQSLDIKGDRYLHITLGLKEDHIPRETLNAIIADFKAFAFSAYRPEEYNLHAEAHLPRIKSYHNQKTGELVERKPHIHLVIPKTNLLTGGFLNPFGMVEHNQRYIDAFQECINQKYGLASPKDNRRITFTSESEMISRYKADEFEGQNVEIKQQLLDDILTKKIERFDDFHSLLATYGEVKIRNAGKENEYFNVKLKGHAKGINLKHYVFSRDFIQLSPSDKTQALSADIQRRYEEASEGQKETALIQETLRDWHHFRAKEIKYLNSGNKKFYAHYKSSTPEEKQQLLNEKIARFYQPHQDSYEPTEEACHYNKKEYESYASQLTTDIGSITYDRQYGFTTLKQVEKEHASHPPKRPSGLEVEQDLNTSIDSPSLQHKPIDSSLERHRSYPIQASEAFASDRYSAYADHFSFEKDKQSSMTSLRQFEKTDSLARVKNISQLDEINKTGKQPDTYPLSSYSIPQQEFNHELSTSHRPYHQRTNNSFNTDNFKCFDGPFSEEDGQHRTITLGGFEKTETIDRVRSLSSRTVVRDTEKRKELLSSHAADHMEHRRADGNDGLRWSNQSHRMGSGEGERKRAFRRNSVVTQILQELNEAHQIKISSVQPDIQTIKRNIDAHRMLNELSQSHGVIVEKYQVQQASDGSPRIRCGTRHLNVSDFLTKELHLTWTEASALLQSTYERQQRLQPTINARQQPDHELWKEFQEYRKNHGRHLGEAPKQQYIAQAKKRNELRKTFELKKAEILDLPSKERKVLLSELAIHQVSEERQLKSSFQLRQPMLKKSTIEQYHDYLHQRANAHDERALHELQRLRIEALHERSAPENRIHPWYPDEPNSIIYRHKQLKLFVQRNGDILYFDNGSLIMEDQGDFLSVLKKDRTTIEVALNLGQAKFGNRLILTGSQAFKEQAARIAAESGIKVEFTDRSLNQLMQDQLSKVISERIQRKLISGEIEGDVGRERS